MPTPRLAITDLGSATEQLIAAMRDGCLDLTEGVREFKKRWILQELAEHRFNQSKAARAMGMHRNTLIRYIYELHLDQAWIRTQRNKLCRDSGSPARAGVARDGVSVARNGRQLSNHGRKPGAPTRAAVARGGVVTHSHCKLPSGNSVLKGGRGESPEPKAAPTSAASVNSCGRLTEGDAA